MQPLPDLTILLGPQTRLSLAVNAHLRENRQYLHTRGIRALPSRLASPMVRRALDDRPLEERAAEFKAATEGRAAVLSAINMFGPPQAGLAKGELFPDAELTLAGLDPIIGGARILLAIDVLPEFFIAAQSDALEDRVRKTPWEILYELSWYELVNELVALLPSAQFLILTDAGVGRDLKKLEATLLGEAAQNMPHPYTLLRHLINSTGTAVLDRMHAQGVPEEATLTELYRSFVAVAGPAQHRERLGLDKVTGILLQQRFEEDLEKIASLPRVEVF
ncbi:MAG: hypothetical protein ACU0GG_21520 [Paracoccaceae bacterium]